MTTHKTLGIASKLVLGFVMFTALSGFRGCTTTSGGASYTGYGSTPPSGGGAVVAGPADGGHHGSAPSPAPLPVLYVGDLALTVYAPLPSPVTPDTVSFNVTVREGGPFGPVVVSGEGFWLDASGAAALDVFDLAYAFYDVEVTGLDAFGSVVSYGAASVNVDEPLASLVVELEPALEAGDVYLDLLVPDNGFYGGAVDSIDYVLWEVDPVTNQLVFVEELTEVPVSPWDSPVIPALELGTYYVEVFGYDAFGYLRYEFAADFLHDSAVTFLPVEFWYAN